MSEDVRVVALIEAKRREESAVHQACEACVGPTRQEAGCDMYVLHRDSQESLTLRVRGALEERAGAEAAHADAAFQGARAGAGWQAYATDKSACAAAGLKGRSKNCRLR